MRAAARWKVNMGWMDAKVDKTYYGFDADQVLDAERFGVAAAYFYPLSKRTRSTRVRVDEGQEFRREGIRPLRLGSRLGLVVWF